MPESCCPDTTGSSSSDQSRPAKITTTPVAGGSYLMLAPPAAGMAEAGANMSPRFGVRHGRSAARGNARDAGCRFTSDRGGLLGEQVSGCQRTCPAPPLSAAVSV